MDLRKKNERPAKGAALRIEGASLLESELSWGEKLNPFPYLFRTEEVCARLENLIA